MMCLKNEGMEEKYPVGLIDIDLWEWPQGVGLYGLYQYYSKSRDPEILAFLTSWFDRHLAGTLPERNVNTSAPLLTLAFLAEETGRKDYLDFCLDWGEWIMHTLIRTGDGAFQHMITGDANDGQILIDTLFMTVLFLAKAGALTQKAEWIEEAKHQCLVHIKYLYDTSCGLFFHGFDFNGMHHYGQVHWGRGNSWYTCGLMELLDIIPVETGLKDYLLDSFRAQIKALISCQCKSGMWRTVLDDEHSYEESSATAAIAFGILKGVRKGYLNPNFEASGIRAAQAVIKNTDASGIVHQVSYGTPVGYNIQFYRDIPVCPMTYGQALSILMLSELLEHDDNSFASAEAGGAEEITI